MSTAMASAARKIHGKRMFQSPYFLIACLAILLCGSDCASGDDLRFGDIVVVLQTQPHPHHLLRAHKFREHFEEQISSLPKNERPGLYLTYEEWPETRGAWTVFPLIPQFIKMFSEKKWIFICEEETRVDIKKVLSVLQRYDSSQDIFLGRELKDKHATIIHHFAFYEAPSVFSYPDFGAGLALTLPLIIKMGAILKEDFSFSIDPKHELALFLKDKLNVLLTPVCALCGNKEETEERQGCDCATWQPLKFPSCGHPVRADELFVAVKTCHKFHNDRVQVVKNTWAPEAEFIEYYSDEVNDSIPTIDLGVPNTEVGHCSKTREIIRRTASHENISTIPWILILDDDTIINLERLRHLLTCYNTYQPLILGERYGYGSSTGLGYDYITGGGGMVFNQPAVKKLAAEFVCAQDHSPDDMLIGMFAAREQMLLIHSPYFHQARPEDYSPEFLSNQVPVSFHKHWNTDPYKIYQLLKKGKPLSNNTQQKNTSKDKHIEL